MDRLSYESTDGVPVFRCSQCGRCDGIETENIFAANRGCCFYFPKYTLIDLRTAASIDPAFVAALPDHPGAVITDECLMVHGLYDQAAHEAFRRDPEAASQAKYRGFDASLQFRKCAFCTETGCTLDFRLRPHPCNLYLCRGVIASCGEAYRDYARERKDYFAFCQYVNGCLADELERRGLSLTTDFAGSIAALLETEADAFECTPLEPIDYA